MSEIYTQTALDAIIAKGKAGKIILSNYQDQSIYLKEKTLYEAFNTAVDKVTATVGDLDATVTRISELEEKQQNPETASSFTEQDQIDLNTLLEKRQRILAAVNSVTATSAKEAQQLSDDLKKAQLAAIFPSGKPGELTYIKPENLAEYIVRTQAINPYSRQRECDTRFLKLLALSGEQADEFTKAQLTALKNLIKERILSS
jgi:vacuolar-type H+-ATPase subunit I/STV1